MIGFQVADGGQRAITEINMYRVTFLSHNSPAIQFSGSPRHQLCRNSCYFSSTILTTQTLSPMFLALCDFTGLPVRTITLPAFGLASR